MKNIYISFILAIYNVESYLEECLDSICNIKRNDIEIILVNDGSTDLCPQICNRFQKSDSRVRVITQKNKGLAAARNAGLTKAYGEWVCFIDGDDWLYDGIQNIIEQLNDNIDLLYFGHNKSQRRQNIEDAAEHSCRILGEKEIENIRISMLNAKTIDKNIIYPNILYSATWSKFIKKEIFEKYNISFSPNASWGEDILINFKILRHIRIAKVYDQVGYGYRIQANSMTQKYNPNAIKDYLNLVEEIKKEVMYEKNDIYFRHFWEFVVKQYLVIIQRSFMNPENKNGYCKIKKDFINTRNIPIVDKGFSQANLQEFNLIIRIGAILCKYRKFFLLKILYRIKFKKDMLKGLSCRRES